MLMADPPAVSFSGLLRQLRTDAKLTQEELADRAAISARSVSDLERAKAQTPHRDTVQALADALGLAGAARANFEAAARGREPAQWTAPGTHAAGKGTATRTLPRDTAIFTGREPQLEQVGAAAGTMASAAAGGIYTIGGMPGVGKTAFAVHAGHQLAGQFPDGQVFLPLHGHTPGHQPVDPSDALASLLQIAGVEVSQIPSGLEERTALWRDRMAGKQVLLLLDDAVGHEQVRPLLPTAAASLVLITSRRHLVALEGAQVISLEPLAEKEAADLLVRLAGRPELDPDDPAVADITRLCGCLPLAIGMLGRQLHHRPAWTAADLAADLAQTHDRLEPMHAENVSVAAAFNLSYQDLTADQQLLFRRLGLHPGTDIDAYSAAALDSIGLAAARGGLDALYDCYLLTEPARGRFRFHDLIRQYAETMAAADPDAEREAAVDQLLAYYLHTTQAADRHLSRHAPARSSSTTVMPPAHTPALSSRERALSWMRAERLNVHAAMDYAAAHDRHDCVIAMSAAMHGFLRSSGHMGQALTLHHMALEAAREVKDQRGEAGALDDLATAQRSTGDRRAAAASLSRALELYQEVGDRAGEATALVHLGRVQHLTDDYPAARAGLNRALELYKELGDQLGQANARYELGIVWRMTADFPAATASLTRALELYRTLGDAEGEADALSNLGIAQYVTNNYPAAAASLSNALELYRAAANQPGEANAVRDLGVVQYLTGDYAGAAASQELALELYQAIGSRFGEANVRYELGILYRTTADLPAAATSLNQALVLYRTLSDQLGAANALTDLGVVKRLMGEFVEANTCLTRALQVYRELHDRLGEAETMNNLGELSLAAGKADEARAWHQRALLIARDIGTPLEEARALEGAGRCHLHDEQRDSGLPLLHEALTIYQHLGSPNAESIEATLQELGENS
jgi:tetratricopeptide (TPR) repeat protein/transcriptional regulator with XRE-family HTH domain